MHIRRQLRITARYCRQAYHLRLRYVLNADAHMYQAVPHQPGLNIQKTQRQTLMLRIERLFRDRQWLARILILQYRKDKNVRRVRFSYPTFIKVGK